MVAVATSEVRWRPSERSRSTFGSAKPPGNFQRDVTAISSCVSGKKTLIFLYETLRQLQLKTLSFKKAWRNTNLYFVHLISAHPHWTPFSWTPICSCNVLLLEFYRVFTVPTIRLQLFQSVSPCPDWKWCAVQVRTPQPQVWARTRSVDVVIPQPWG